MIATEIDSLWFHSHPSRRFRLRRQTITEVAAWPVRPGEGFEAWCIIHRDDGAMEVFAVKPGDGWDDYDEELEPFFNELKEVAR